METRLPAGVVTFLFSDIEGSTKLLHELGDDYADALAEHRQLLREAFSTHEGVEVDTQGDAFFVAFARASDAVASAADVQRALAATGVAVRIGLHTGEPERTIEGYVGLDVHRGARIAHAAHGGQVLLSGATQALVDAPVRDLGRHRLKDLAEPERIFQLEIRGVPSDFPPIRTLEAGSSNLPLPTTSFVGRDAELDLIDARLDDPSCRILTLTGPGGAGKTRLAVEAARRRLDRYQHGVYLVPLAAVSDQSLLVPSVANALGFTIDSLWGPGRTPEAQLVDHLSERSILLVLDNLEHLLDGADLLATIAAAAPDVQLLATSRERLAVAAEWVLEVKGLRDAAIQLFAERARQVDSAFRLNGDTESVRRICRAVEYMPLGVELAAATVRMLGAASLAEEIERDLDAVTAARRDAPERHRSLRAVFEGSWRCLDDDERAALARLTVLRGAFTREAAVEVAETTLDVLSRLVDKSLVRRTDVRRFEVHELIRQYAAEGLERDPEAATATSQRHAEYFCRLLEMRAARLEGREMLAARDELRLERDNLVVAAQRAVVHWPADRAQAVLRALDSFFMVDSWAEGAEVFERLGASCDRAPGDGVMERLAAIRSWRLAAVNAAERSDAVALAMLPAIRAANDTWALGVVLLALGTNTVNRGDAVESCRYLEEGRALIVDRDEPTLLCWIDLWLGWAMLLLDEPAPARDMFEEALAAVQTTGSEVNIAFALSKLGIAAEYEGDFAGGLRYHLEAHGRFEHVGDPAGVGYAMSRASVDAYALGAFSDALGYSEKALEAWRSIDHPWGISYSLARAGLAQARLGSIDEARARMTEAYEAARDADIEYLMTYATAGWGVLLWQEGDAERAASILGSVLADESFPSLVKRHFDGDRDAIHAELGPDRLGMIMARSAGRTPSEIAAEVFPRRDDALMQFVSI